MGDPADVAFAAVASQRLGNLSIAKSGVIDPDNMPAAAQGLLQQAGDLLPPLFARQHLVELQMGKALAQHLAEPLNAQAMRAVILPAAHHQHLPGPRRHSPHH